MARCHETRQKEYVGPLHPASEFRDREGFPRRRFDDVRLLSPAGQAGTVKKSAQAHKVSCFRKQGFITMPPYHFHSAPMRHMRPST